MVGRNITPSSIAFAPIRGEAIHQILQDTLELMGDSHGLIEKRATHAAQMRG